MYFATVLLISSVSLLVMGSRANTIAHTTRMRHGTAEKDDLRVIMTKTIALGVRMALEQCKSSFKWDRWNCPESAFAAGTCHSFVRGQTFRRCHERLLVHGESKHGKQYLKHWLMRSFHAWRYDSPASREMAYVSSVTSAGIVHAVTRSCSRGSMDLCGCVKDTAPSELYLSDQKKDEENDSVQAEWEWRGCSDDVTMGALVAKTFLAALEGASADVLSRVNLHNSQLGLAVVRDSVKPECKCHGMSGSCTTKTCWRRIEPFSQIGEKLKHRYSRALRIQMNSPKLSPAIPESLMVFIDESPDYCKPNATTGWPGTGGRVCSRGRLNNTDKAEKRSCRELCRTCGHQVKRRHVKESWDCNCSFQWCCKVECTTCHRTVLQRYCDDTPHRY